MATLVCLNSPLSSYCAGDLKMVLLFIGPCEPNKGTHSLAATLNTLSCAYNGTYFRVDTTWIVLLLIASRARKAEWLMSYHIEIQTSKTTCGWPVRQLVPQIALVAEALWHSWTGSGGLVGLDCASALFSGSIA